MHDNTSNHLSHIPWQLWPISSTWTRTNTAWFLDNRQTLIICFVVSFWLVYMYTSSVGHMQTTGRYNTICILIYMYMLSLHHTCTLYTSSVGHMQSTGSYNITCIPIYMYMPTFSTTYVHNLVYMQPSSQVFKYSYSTSVIPKIYNYTAYGVCTVTLTSSTHSCDHNNHV